MKNSLILYLMLTTIIVVTSVSVKAQQCSVSWSLRPAPYSYTNNNCKPDPLFKHDEWELSWTNGDPQEVVISQGTGDTFLSGPNASGTCGRECWPDFLSPSVRSWSANGYEYREWTQDIYNKKNSSAGCIVDGVVHISRSAIHSCGGGGGGHQECELDYAGCDQTVRLQPTRDVRFTRANHRTTPVFLNVNRCCVASPIIIDILGNGYAMTDAQAGVDFDFNGDGIPHRMSWTSAASELIAEKSCAEVLRRT